MNETHTIFFKLKRNSVELLLVYGDWY